MSAVVIYHNPRCSKSRQTLELLREHEVEPEIVEYLKEPLAIADLAALARKLGKRPREFVRTKEEAFKSLSVDLDDDAVVLATLAEHPVLLERPIVVRGDRAVIGRPPENILELLEGVQR